ncbi:MAG: hypothetical protein QXV81_08450 [Ignisphaera sp.]|uniref:Uncharacterized protein n=1 Tax=Ignisphaera aggregans TaxID=334771 RepID=A0A7J3JNL9_9CREN
MRIRISLCSMYSYRDPPIPRSRHITPMISLCHEVSERIIDKHALPEDILDSINRVGYADIFNVEKAKVLFGIELSENQYVKIVLIE